MNDFVAALTGRCDPRKVQEFVLAITGRTLPSAGKPPSIAIEDVELQEFLADISTCHEAFWDPAKHPRGYFSQNRGWFSPVGTSDSSTPASALAGPAPGSPGGSSKPPSKKQPADPPLIRNPDTKPKSPKRGRLPSESDNLPPRDFPTKPRLPADRRGKWVLGKKGHGVFQYHDTLKNRRAGLARKRFRFLNGYIAVGGFPVEFYYGGNAAAATVTIGRVTGTEADRRAAIAAMRDRLGNPSWRTPEGYDWNHAGGPGSRVMELVKRTPHNSVAHKGSAAGPRAAQRFSATGKVIARSLGVVAAYLTVRDALAASGLTGLDFEVAEEGAYAFTADDGSHFVVYPGGRVWGAPYRTFVSGPRAGESETIDDGDFESYRVLGEEQWGKYVPGGLFSGPRFIPGTQRSRLPLFDHQFGVSREIGWIDEHGVHYYPTPKVEA